MTFCVVFRLLALSSLYARNYSHHVFSISTISHTKDECLLHWAIGKDEGKRWCR